MRIFKTRWLARFARREAISDASMAEAIARAERGLIDADLGGGLIKQRVARTGQGRSGGYRMLIVYRRGDRAVCVFGFAKSDQDDISPAQLYGLRTVAARWLSADETGIKRGISAGELKEI